MKNFWLASNGNGNENFENFEILKKFENFEKFEILKNFNRNELERKVLIQIQKNVFLFEKMKYEWM